MIRRLILFLFWLLVAGITGISAWIWTVDGTPSSLQGTSLDTPYIVVGAYIATALSLLIAFRRLKRRDRYRERY